MIKVVSDDYLKKKSKYKHYVLGCCAKCRNIRVYKVTDDVLKSNCWGSAEKCDECGGLNSICVLSKYQKPPGFARKCKKCDFKFTCATTRMEELSTVLIGVMNIKFEWQK